MLKVLIKRYSLELFADKSAPTLQNGAIISNLQTAGQVHNAIQKLVGRITNRFNSTHKSLYLAKTQFPLL